MDFHGSDACGVGVVAQVYLVGSDDQLLLAKQMINEIVQGADQARTCLLAPPALPRARPVRWVCLALRLSERAAIPSLCSRRLSDLRAHDSVSCGTSEPRLMALNAAQNDGGGGRRGGAAGIPGGGGSGFRGQGGGGAQSGLGDSGCAAASCLPFFRDAAR